MSHDGDPPRLLHARSQFGYTSRQVEALPGEPEAVPIEVQRAFVLAARRRAERRLREEWRRAAARIGAAIDDFKAAGVADAQLLADLRTIERGLVRVNERMRHH